MGKLIHLEWLKSSGCYNLISYYVDKNDFSEAYRVANEKGGNQLPRELTLYLYKESGVFYTDPLYYMDYIPSNYLYEAFDGELVVNIPSSVEEIQDFAFMYASIKRIIIPKSVKRIGTSALRLNSGEIVYEGTKQEFINQFLGKSLCFKGTNGQIITCLDGIIEIKK